MIESVPNAKQFKKWEIIKEGCKMTANRNKNKAKMR